GRAKARAGEVVEGLLRVADGGGADGENGLGRGEPALVGLDVEDGDADLRAHGAGGANGVAEDDGAGAAGVAVDEVEGGTLADGGGAGLEAGDGGEVGRALGRAVFEDEFEAADLTAGEGAGGGVPADGLGVGERRGDGGEERGERREDSENGKAFEEAAHHGRITRFGRWRRAIAGSGPGGVERGVRGSPVT